MFEISQKISANAPEKVWGKGYVHPRWLFYAWLLSIGRYVAKELWLLFTARRSRQVSRKDSVWYDPRLRFNERQKCCIKCNASPRLKIPSPKIFSIDIHHDIKFCLLAWRDQPKSRDLVFHLRQIILTLERPDLGKVYAIYHLPPLLHSIKKSFTQ